MGIELDGANHKLKLDNDGDTYLEADTDDTIKCYVAGAEDLRIAANAINVLSGTTLTIDSGATITNSGTANGFGSNLPSSADGQALGSASAEWSDLFLADGGIIYFGNDQDINITHVADTGLTTNGTITANAGLKADNITIDGTEIDLSSGDLLIDAAGDINLDADGGDVRFQDDGTVIGAFTNTSSNFTIESKVQDKDIIFSGNDGGSVITALTLDMSAAGASAFNSYITSTAIYGKGDDNTGIQFDGSDVITMHTGGTNRMTMASNGDVHIPNTSGNGYMTIKGGSSETYVVHNGTATGNTTLYMFKVGGTEVGTINRTSSQTIYNTSSDYRLKENETAITDGITRVKQLKPYKFNFKVDPDTKVDGFFAHEVSGIVPEAISGEKDAVYENKDIKPQGIDQSKIVPLLTAALKESITKIETLETKVKALEEA